MFMGLFGYYLFRVVNYQKDIARKSNGDCYIWGKKAEVIRAQYTTSDGKLHHSILLCSGEISSASCPFLSMHCLTSLLHLSPITQAGGDWSDTPTTQAT